MNPGQRLGMVLAFAGAALALPFPIFGGQVSESPRPTSSGETSSRAAQYVVFNRAPGRGMSQFVPETLGLKQFEEVLTRFPNRPAARIQIGVSYIFSVFRTPPETTMEALRVFLRAAEQTDTPVLVQIDTEQWWEARPDLWNWWDPARPGFDPANRHNVEWTSWSPEDALKIAWRNWGRQIRVLPPPNLASPRYVDACREEIRRLVPIVLDWRARLPGGKKHLLIGIKLGHETSIGVNAYHYPSGNELLGRPAAEDPVRPLNGDDVLARGMAQLGFAALTTSGIRASGTPVENELRDVAQRYLEMLCREAAQAGVPRELLFAHGAGWMEGELVYDVPVNAFACPAWSFYRHAVDPQKDTGVQRNLARSQAPYWAATEWLFQGPDDRAAWAKALRNTLADPRCRYVCIFNWESIRSRDGVLNAIDQVIRPNAPGEANQFVTPQRLPGNPIILPEMLPGDDGSNINGPALLRAPPWLTNRLGTYYLYFAHHNGTYIRLAYSDRLEGPWKVYGPGTLRLHEAPACSGHIASPDVHADDARGEIRMYFHGPSKRGGGQKSYVAISKDGLHFKATDEVLGPFYFRVFQWQGAWYAMAKGGQVYRSQDGLSQFVECHNPFPGAELRDPEANTPGPRHVAPHRTGNELRVYYSNIGDAPERILRCRIHLAPDCRTWVTSAPEEVLRPETESEGAGLPLKKSVAGAMKGRENALRDPGIFVDSDGRVYLLYSVAGESGIAIAELTSHL